MLADEGSSCVNKLVKDAPPGNGSNASANVADTVQELEARVQGEEVGIMPNRSAWADLSNGDDDDIIFAGKQLEDGPTLSEHGDDDGADDDVAESAVEHINDAELDADLKLQASLNKQIDGLGRTKSQSEAKQLLCDELKVVQFRIYGRLLSLRTHVQDEHDSQPNVASTARKRSKKGKKKR